MALVVETGAGLTGADSFASMEDADAFWAARGSAGAPWAAAAAPDREACLREATGYVASRLGTRLPYSTSQGLPWPWDDYDPTPYDRARLARATILCADVARLGPLVGGAARGPRVVSESRTLGPLSRSTTYADAAPAQASGRDLSFVDDMLRGMVGGGGMVLGQRARG